MLFTKEDLENAFEEGRCDGDSFEDWFYYNFISELPQEKPVYKSDPAYIDAHSLIKDIDVSRGLFSAPERIGSFLTQLGIAQPVDNTTFRHEEKPGV